MMAINKFGLLLALFSTTSFALPTVYQKTLSASVGGGVYGGLNSDVALDSGVAGASAGAVGANVAGSNAFASAHASASSDAAGSAVIEKQITYGHKNIPQRTEVIAEKTFTETPKVVSEHTIQGQAQVQRTVIEKTVIPQYVEKTIQVPSYVEKTIRVPTVVEHKVRVPVTPKVVEKTYEENGHAHAGAIAGGRVQLQARPTFYAQKQFGIRTNAAVAGSSAGTAYAGANAYSGGGAGDSSASFQVNKNYNGPGLLGNILNIPIATLGAVGNLFNNGNAGGYVSFNKNYRAY